MTIGLTLTQGSTTVDLNCSTCSLAYGDWTPSAGKREDETVTESMELIFFGTSIAAVTATIESVENILRLAHEYDDQFSSERCFINLTLTGGAAYRSEVKDGRLTLSLDAIAWIERGYVAKGQLSLTRMNWWEGAETQISLTNGNGSDNTSGLNVYNCNDGSGSSPNKKHNYVEITAAKVAGNLPAPMRIEMTNLYSTSGRLYDVFIAQNVHSTPGSFNQLIEGEAVVYGGTSVAGATQSGGYNRQFTWAGSSQTWIASWVLSSSLLDYAKGQWFKVLARMGSKPSSGTRLQCKITFPGGGIPLTVVSTSQEVLLSTGYSLQDIATLQLPPWLPGETGQAALDITLYARRSGGGTVIIDDLMLMPVEGYRILTPRGYGAAYGVRIADDGIAKTIWTDGWSPAGKTGHYTAIGKPILLEPGKLQRLYFMQRSDTGEAEIARVMSVKIYYRPRRLSL